MCMANTAYWRMETTYGQSVNEHRVGIWQTCETEDGQTQCSEYRPGNAFYPEDLAHLRVRVSTLFTDDVTVMMT